MLVGYAQEGVAKISPLIDFTYFFPSVSVRGRVLAQVLAVCRLGANTSIGANTGQPIAPIARFHHGALFHQLEEQKADVALQAEWRRRCLWGRPALWLPRWRRGWHSGPRQAAHRGGVAVRARRTIGASKVMEFSISTRSRPRPCRAELLGAGSQHQDGIGRAGLQQQRPLTGLPASRVSPSTRTPGTTYLRGANVMTFKASMPIVGPVVRCAAAAGLHL